MFNHQGGLYSQHGTPIYYHSSPVSGHLVLVNGEGGLNDLIGLASEIVFEKVTEGTVYISVRSEGTRFAHRLRSESHNFERRSTDAPPPGKCMKKRG